MRNVFFLLVACCSFFGARAQLKDSIDLSTIYNNPALEARYKQKLVELATSNPTRDMLNAQEEVANYQVSSAKAQWLNRFIASGNLNEYSIKGNSVNGQNYYYPRYNFSVVLPLGTLVTIPNDVKIARANRKLITATKERDAREVKIAVLRMWEALVANDKQLKLHTPLLEDALAGFTQTETKFKAGDASVEAYNTAFRTLNTEQSHNVALVREYWQSFIDLEGAVGTTLRQVLLSVQQ